MINVSIDGHGLAGSPFNVTAVNLQPEPTNCVLHGEALTLAVARQPMAFKVDFVDALGNTAYAEELDVRVERIDPIFDAASTSGTAAAEGVRKPSGMIDQGEAELDAVHMDDTAIEERLQEEGTLRLLLQKASGLEALDMSGKSDPYVILKIANREHKSTVKSKSLSPVWNEEFLMKGSLQDFVSSSLVLNLYHCDNPSRPERDQSLGELSVSTEWLRGQNERDFNEVLPTKGKLAFSLIWEPPSLLQEEQVPNYVVGDERVVIGTRPLVLRQGFATDSEEVAKLPPGTRLQLHEICETEHGFRAHVRVLRYPQTAHQNQLPNPQKDDVVGWITAAHKDGRRRLMRRHLKTEANERRRQAELWNRREVADRAVNSAKANGKVGTAFKHEIAECSRGIAFAFGGVFPGVLHARGALVKTHNVSYSVGAAGQYLLHVGLRKQEATLPGSPFKLVVKPGRAHAPCSRLPEDSLPLETIVGTSGNMTVRLSDNVGNQCTEGGEQLDVAANSDQVQLTCTDQFDGSYHISWSSKVSGAYMIGFELHGAHVLGSPVPLMMVAGEIEPMRCEVLTPGEAIAGAAAKIEVQCRDAFGNELDADSRLQFGMLLLAMPSNEKSSGSKSSNKSVGAEGDDDRKTRNKLNKEERANLVKTLDSLLFDGVWQGSTHKMTFVPHEAGDFEMHVVSASQALWLVSLCKCAILIL